MDELIEGRLVHYVLYPGEHRAAIITHVQDMDSGIVEVYIFWRSYDSEHQKMYTPTTWIKFDAKAESANTWHWIEKP